jgi:mannitol/fructose-specific phosphotransferase system IIA component (Ntr-type)
MEQLQVTTRRGEDGDVSPSFHVACVAPLEAGGDKRSVPFQLVSSLASNGEIPRASIDSLVVELLVKERLSTSAWGNGLAFPYLRSWMVNRPVVIPSTAPGGIDFGSLDGCPTRLVILLLSAHDSLELHAEILGHFAAGLYDGTLPYWLQATRSVEELSTRLGIKDQELKSKLGSSQTCGTRTERERSS